MDFFNDFDDIFSKMWNKFSRPVQDQTPYSVYVAPGKGYVVVCNTLGMDRNDLTVNIEKHKGSPYPTLRIKGETTLEKINFHNKIDMAIQLKLEDSIESISYEVKNGLTTVFLKVKIEEEPKIEARCIDDNEALDW